MTATNHTEHYESSRYTEDDHPTYAGDYDIIGTGTPTRNTESEESHRECHQQNPTL